jgi:hypothetical protein
VTKTRGNARYRRGYTKAPSAWRRTCGGNDGSDFVEDADNDVAAALALARCRAAMASTLSFNGVRLKHRSNYFSLTLSKNIRDFAGRAKIANISEY